MASPAVWEKTLVEKKLCLGSLERALGLLPVENRQETARQRDSEWFLSLRALASSWWQARQYPRSTLSCQSIDTAEVVIQSTCKV